MIYILLACLISFWSEREYGDRLDAMLSSFSIGVSLMYVGIPGMIEMQYRLAFSVLLSLVSYFIARFLVFVLKGGLR